MSAENIIQYDSVHHLNHFWPLGTDPKRLEEAIRKESERLTLEPAALIKELNERFRTNSSYKFGSVSLDVEWGHPDDWAAKEFIITPEAMPPTPSFDLKAGGLPQEIDRGIVAWVWLRDESERGVLHERVRSYVEDQGAASGSKETPLPVIAIIPREPVPELEQILIRLKALEAIGKRKDLLDEIGQHTYEQEHDRTKAALGKALRQLRGNAEQIWDIQRNPEKIVVPQAYQAAVAASEHGLSIKKVLEQLYDLAYHIRPPEFFTQYSALVTKGQSKLRSAVKTVAKNLLYDRIGSALSGMDSVSKDLCEKYLSKKWGMLTQSRGASGPLALQKPTSPKLQPAWDWLDRTFAPGVQDARLSDIIPKLLKPPYGFDYNTVMLLLCGWFGYHRSELLLSRQGRRIKLEDLEQEIETNKTARDFLNWAYVNGLALSRRDPDVALQEMRSLRARIIKKQPPFSQAEAGEAVQALYEFALQEKQPPDVRQQAAEAAGCLRKALEAAQKYDQEVRQILAHLDSSHEASDLLKQRQRLPSLNVDELVIVTQPAISEIEDRIFTELEQTIEAERYRVEKLTDITQTGALEQRLRTLKSQLEKQGLTPFAQQAATIVDALQKRIAQLKAAEQETAIRKEVEAMTVDTSLTQLGKYHQRLREMVLVSPELKQIRDRKQEAIQREIDNLKTFAAGITEQVRSVHPNDVQQMQKRILNCQSRYVGTQYEQMLGQALGYLETLQQFLAEVRNLEQLPLTTPQDAQNAKQRLREIEARFKERLSAFHLKALNQVHESIADRLKTARQQAIQWLETLERDQYKVPLGELQHKLEHPPAFLPTDHQPRLDALRAHVQERLDQDHIAQIELLFRSLGTPEKRKECLNRLLQLGAEEI